VIEWLAIEALEMELIDVRLRRLKVDVCKVSMRRNCMLLGDATNSSRFI
jgi:hypothetical protein